MAASRQATTGLTRRLHRPRRDQASLAVHQMITRASPHGGGAAGSIASGVARSCVREAIGAFALVFAGCGAVMVAAETSAFGAAGIAAAFGLVIGAMVYALGHVSGAHFNPAVTVTFALIRRSPWRQVPAYVAAQVVGALVAAGVPRFTLGNVASLGATTPSGSSAQSFVWEIVLTFFLMLVIMAVATDTQAVGEAAALAIGATVGLGALVGGPVSGASMNPARSIGPALVSGEVGDLWMYLIAPPVGALIAGVAYTVLLRGSRNAPKRAASGPVFTIPNPVGHFIHTHSTAISRHSECMITADITTAHSPCSVSFTRTRTGATVSSPSMCSSISTARRVSMCSASPITFSARTTRASTQRSRRSRPLTS